MGHAKWLANPRRHCHRAGMSATIHRLDRKTAPSLDPMMALVADDMNAVNAVILNRMQSRIPLIPELAGHLIASGGKRLRPMLTLACARLLDYSGTRHHKLSACVEFIHTATLLHDDVVDGSGLRRGKATANIIWGNSASVLVGDFLFSRSFELMVEDGSLKVLKILSNASAVIAEGEVNQLTAQRRIDTDEAQYLDIISSKTAALFAAACRIAAVVAERDQGCEMALDGYGRNLGIAFQLVDDAIDYVSDGATMVMQTYTASREAEAEQIEVRLCSYEPGHRWYYFSDMRPDELLIFKGYDSDRPQSASGAHVAFDNPLADEPNGRISIEARYIIFWN